MCFLLLNNAVQLKSGSADIGTDGSKYMELCVRLVWLWDLRGERDFCLGLER